MLKPIKKALDVLDKFFNDDTTYYAASLSFFTIFSILPIIALLIFIISKLEVVQNYLDLFMSYILDFLNPTHSDVFVSTFNSFLSNTDNLGEVGIVYMLFVFIMFIKDYEYIVNKIHEAKRKPIFHSFVFYLIFLIALPIMFMIFNIIISFYENSIFISILSFTFAWSIFFALFKLSVNKKVHTKAAAISSLLTLITLTITKNLFVYYVIYNKTYTTLYGSLATLLFIFFWIYVSWVIFLYGVKMCHQLNIKEESLNSLKESRLNNP